MLRGRWIGMLLFCLLVAGVFAWLGQWQLERAIETDPPAPGATEQVQPLTAVVEPGEYLAEPLVGQRVETTGTWVPGDFLVVAKRFNDGAEGYWVTGQLRVAERASIAVAIGWAPDRESADAAVDRMNDDDGSVVELSGRIISDEGPAVPPHDDPTRMERMSTAALLGFWHDTEQLDVYRPYLASTTALGGLDDIASPAPAEQSPVNWLNVFYAAEWVIFAGFAFYLWYRLAKDAWEREVEEFEDAEAA
ncbi:SURF1 family cytochrome oxidase biogenesis protein [uncultured Microbacterium sp.]|uniref:SURF1 family protein n=1 Tax=uncultured Microbacterium sp. TaxID=191216 RepID=UPI0028DC7149|nr:SURF1 family cytochrome oxidase biogenesis protein [uncultured Microbacterium sp.]